jgi:hypothetical protein
MTQECIEVAQDVTLAALIRDDLFIGATSLEKLKWVLDELAFPRAMQAI